MGDLLAAAFQFLGDVVCYGTGRVVLKVISGGKYPSPDPSSSEFGWTWALGGTIVFALLGLVLWGLVTWHAQ